MVVVSQCYHKNNYFGTIQSVEIEIHQGVQLGDYNKRVTYLLLREFDN